MFSLSVFITVLLVGMVWFRSFQSDLYVLMNPQEDVEKMLAVESAPVPSLFDFVWQTAGDVKGLISSLFGKIDQQPTINDQQLEKIKIESGKVYTFPLSERK